MILINSNLDAMSGVIFGEAFAMSKRHVAVTPQADWLVRIDPVRTLLEDRVRNAGCHRTCKSDCSRALRSIQLGFKLAFV